MDRISAQALAAVPGEGRRLCRARIDLIPGPTGPVPLELEVDR